MTAEAAVGEKLTYSVAEVAALLGVSRRLIYDAIDRGEIRAIRLGVRKLVPKVVVTDLIAASAGSES